MEERTSLPLFLLHQDACARLGIGRERLRTLVRQGDIAAVGVTVGGLMLYRPGDVDRLAETLVARGVGRLAAKRKKAEVGDGQAGLHLVRAGQ